MPRNPWYAVDDQKLPHVATWRQSLPDFRIDCITAEMRTHGDSRTWSCRPATAFASAKTRSGRVKTNSGWHRFPQGCSRQRGANSCGAGHCLPQPRRMRPTVWIPGRLLFVAFHDDGAAFGSDDVMRAAAAVESVRSNSTCQPSGSRATRMTNRERSR
jgi:hypothetical protein